MKNYKYSIKKVIIGSTMGAAVLFGAAGMANAQTGSKDSSSPHVTGKTIDTTAADRAKLKGAEEVGEAKSAVRAGYLEGFKRGQKDGSKSRKYNASVVTPDEEQSPTSASLSRNYKRFYEAGFTRGYEDGYNKTSTYGESSENDGKTAYTVFVKVLDELVGGSE